MNFTDVGNKSDFFFNLRPKLKMMKHGCKKATAIGRSGEQHTSPRHRGFHLGRDRLTVWDGNGTFFGEFLRSFG